MSEGVGKVGFASRRDEAPALRESADALDADQGPSCRSQTRTF